MYPLLASTPYHRELTPKKYRTLLPHKQEDNMQISVKWLPSTNVDCQGTINPEREYQMMFLRCDSCLEWLSGYGRWPYWCSHPSTLPPPDGHQECFGFILPPLLENKLAPFEQCLLNSPKQINNIFYSTTIMFMENILCSCPSPTMLPINAFTGPCLSAPTYYFPAANRLSIMDYTPPSSSSCEQLTDTSTNRS